MKVNTALGFFFFGTLSVCQWTSAAEDGRSNLRQRHLDQAIGAVQCLETTDIACSIQQKDTEYGTKEDTAVEEVRHDVGEQFVCRLEETPPLAYSIFLPPIIQQAYRRYLETFDEKEDDPFSVQVTEVCIDKSNAKIVVTKETKFNLLHHNNGQHRDLMQPRARRLTDNGTMGVRLVLVLRISYLGIEPTLTASELQGRVFGKGPNQVEVSLQSQMEDCSAGQLRLRVVRGTNVVNGIAEIAINQKIAFGQNPIQNLENEAVLRATSIIDTFDRADHVMIVLPEPERIFGTRAHNFIAYAYIRGTISVYSNLWAGYFSCIAHEIGHNLGLHHSSYQQDVYGDTSSLMGYSYRIVSGPKICFNAQNNYILRWYQSRQRRLDPEDLPWTGNLAFFGDFARTGDNNLPVLIHMSRPGHRLFLQYNKAEGVNDGNTFWKDRVVVVQDFEDPGTRGAEMSSFRGEIATGGNGRLRVQNFHNLNENIMIRVCGRNNQDLPYLRLSIYLEGAHNDTCDEEPTYFCDDDPVTRFQVKGQGTKDCVWLRKNLEGNEHWCENTEDAYHICAETCGQCSDSCQDDLTKTFLIKGQGQKDCQWLSENPNWQDSVCYAGHKAFDACQESCDRCD